MAEEQRDAPPPGADIHEIQDQPGLRSLDGRFGTLVVALAVAVALVTLYLNAFGILWVQIRAWVPGLPQPINPSTLWRNAFHFAGFGLLCALLYPAISLRRGAGRQAVLAFDICFGLLVAFCALYLIAVEEEVYRRGTYLSWREWTAGTVVVLGALEYARRTTGWIIPILIVVALSYVTWLGPSVPGMFRFPGLTAETVMFRSIYSDEGLFGIIAEISSSIVVMFIIFGAFLLRSGAGAFVIDLARAVAGRMTGGPGFVAVIASGLTGTISGSSVANTASTGVITIPLMKRAGFPPKFAGGVEAAASTGGQLMPPIMGAGAFVMASMTQISYTTIIAVAFLPAVLYFLTVAFFVRIEAQRQGLTYDPSEEAPRTLEVLKRGPAFLLPIALLIYLLIDGFTPTYAAGLAILAVVVCSWFTPDNRMGIKAIIEALALGARNMVMTAVLLVAIGLLVNVITTTGVGNTLSLLIVNWAGGSLVIALLLVALASLVLGMGLPVTAAYIVLAPLTAPALQSLIVDSQLIDLLVTGSLPESAHAFFMLAAPEAVPLLSTGMGETQARELLDQMRAIDPMLLTQIRDQVLSRETIVLALLSAHMIVFWLSQDSNVTPPVCLTAFTAAAIARTSPMGTGVQSWKLAKGLYIIPLLFAYTNFLGGPFLEVMEIFLFSIVGLYAFCAFFQGHMEGPVSLPVRLLLLAVAAACLWPHSTWHHFVGTAVFLPLFFLNWRRARQDLGSEKAPAA